MNEAVRIIYEVVLSGGRVKSVTKTCHNHYTICLLSAPQVGPTFMDKNGKCQKIRYQTRTEVELKP